MRTRLTKKEAISVLPDRNSIHTIYNSPFSPLDADWSRKNVVDKIMNSDIIELTGNIARRMKRGICVYDKTTTKESEILFIETDEEKFSQLEKQIKMEKEEVNA